ncbi:MAG: methyltransferase domain-containing protein [Armatimonadia bacterium]
MIRREGCLAALERGWARGFEAVAALRVSHLLGRLRNLWRLPGLRRRHHGGTLNLGCGPDRRAEWLNADLGLTGDIHLDASRRFPFRDDWFTMVFTEHMLEHLSEGAAAVCLQECYRVLQPGGTLRVSTPDLGYVVGKYVARDLAHRQETASVSPWKYGAETLPTDAQALNDGFYLWEHRHLYDAEDLRRVMEAAGFVGVEVQEAGEPGEGPESRKHGSLVAEGKKSV